MKTKILAEEKDFLVCFKPSGLAVQSARASEADMVSELKNYLVKTTGSRSAYLGLIHRLDQPVSGILVFAKNQNAAANLSRQVADHVMKKTYRAAVYCKDSEISVESHPHKLTDYMIKEAGGGAKIVDAKDKDAKKAELIYRCLERREDVALMEVDLLTGRHHQIRLQMSHAGLPLLGDTRYGSPESLELSRQKRIRAVQLQAVRLEFLHPVTGKKVVYELDEKLTLG